ncbi:hypothetical protein Q4603_02855 [Zobellia galactanivorans]|uniref:hypothetical protein n=1 Tax=Zobellia galactanivorans (strain DSM 12802 / CCUG 47099 / CIP 106680 / NCIMB 13871 / Dsij) TaxID=63186 RepID=UPI0026E16041|nr:hypothetical protein [Zobellia galactanivorans]MDO6807527.1 hypothetical protein [Zobellia galactanivorans]
MNRKNVIFLSRILILFLMVSYVTDKLVYFGIRQIENGVYTGQSVGKLNQYLSIKDSLDFIVFGSSRANHHINPSLISENGYNMGMDGQKIAFSATLFKLLPNRKQTVLFHIDPENAVDDLYKADDLGSLKAMYYKNEIVRNEIDKYKKMNPLQKFYWCISYNGILFGVIKNYLKPNYNYTTYNGYDPLRVNNSSNRNVLELKEGEMQMECAKREYTLNPIYRAYLLDLKGFSEKNGKRLIFFTSPKLFDNCKEDNLFLSEEMNKMNLTYKDFSDFFGKNSDVSNWKDATHMSEKGAIYFTNYVARTVYGSKVK